MKAYGPSPRLGIYQREVGAKLRLDAPMNSAEAHNIIRYVDEGYAAATLLRLAQKGIAAGTEGGFVRGPNWKDVADYYGWKYYD